MPVPRRPSILALHVHDRAMHRSAIDILSAQSRTHASDWPFGRQLRTLEKLAGQLHGDHITIHAPCLGLRIVDAADTSAPSYSVLFSNACRRIELKLRTPGSSGYSASRLARTAISLL